MYSSDALSTYTFYTTNTTIHLQEFFSFSPPVLLRYNWHLALYKFKVYTDWFGILIYYKIYKTEHTYITEWLPPKC